MSSILHRRAESSRSLDRVALWSAKPLTGSRALFGWIAATALFFVVMYLLGGPSEGDSAESFYTIWAMAHGHFACDFITSRHFHLGGQANPYAGVAPFFPMIGAVLFDLLRLGHSASAYPTMAAMGNHCQNAVPLAFHWSEKNPQIVTSTLKTAYVAWFFVLWGYVAVIRTTKWSKTHLEALGAVLMAVNLPVTMPLAGFYHPQDLIAVGLSLVALAEARRGRWVWAGVAVGVGFTSQQMALFVAVLLVVLAPWERGSILRSAKVRFVAGAGAAVAAIGLPVILTSPIGGLRAVVLGSSRAGEVRGFGGTVIWELNLHGALQFFVARVAPFIATAALAYYFKKKLGDRIFDPPYLVALATLAYLTRLVFEVNLFGYYFTATAILLLLLDVVRGGMRRTTLVWLGLVTAEFEPVHVGLFSNWTSWEIPLHYAVLDVMLAIALLSILYDATRRTFHISSAVFVVVVGVTTSWLPGVAPIFQPSTWVWQVYLVPEAINLAWLALSVRPSDGPEPEEASLEPAGLSGLS